MLVFYTNRLLLHFLNHKFLYLKRERRIFYDMFQERIMYMKKGGMFLEIKVYIQYKQLITTRHKIEQLTLSVRAKKGRKIEFFSDFDENLGRAIKNLYICVIIIIRIRKYFFSIWTINIFIRNIHNNEFHMET